MNIKQKITNGTKYVVATLGSILVIFLLAWWCFKLSRFLLSGAHDGFMGSLFGGIFGGLVAWFISRYQIWRQEQIHLENLNKELRSILVALYAEVKHNGELMDSFVNEHRLTNSHQDALSQIRELRILSDEIWREVRLRPVLVHKLSSSMYEKVAEIYRNQAIVVQHAMVGSPIKGETVMSFEEDLTSLRVSLQSMVWGG